MSAPLPTSPRRQEPRLEIVKQTAPDAVNPPAGIARPGEVIVSSAPAGADPFLAFDSEHPAPAETNATSASKPGARRRVMVWGIAGGVGLLAVGGALGYWLIPRGSGSGAVVPSGTAESGLVVSSTPPGIAVTVDGEPRGVTPLRLALSPANHLVELGTGPARRSATVAVEPGAFATAFFDLTGPASPPPASTETGSLRISSEPSGARVAIDGVPSGVTPLQLTNLSAGQHSIVVSTPEMSAARAVTVAAGSNVSIVVPLARVLPSFGTLQLQSRVDLEVSEGDRSLGSSALGAIRLAPGPHELSLVNDELEFRTTLSLTVPAGEKISREVPLPNGLVFINAIPWANITVAGRAVGQTPLANVAVPIGSHVVVATHPQLGERRSTVIVKAKSPARLVIDFAK